MDTGTQVPTIEPEVAQDTRGIGGHPRGLTTLFFTEMWERFSYYGMRALLVLFMKAPVAEGGLGFDTLKAASIYGTYTGAVYLMSVPGGWVADNILGARLAVLIGGIIIALGHFSMAIPSVSSFYAGLVLIVIGTGLLKPNISTMVGALYGERDNRRDGGFSIFYMGINIGALVAPLVCGTLAQTDWFKNILQRAGFNPEGSWHWAFGAAGVGMTLGLVQYLISAKRVQHVGNRPQKKPRLAAHERAAHQATAKASSVAVVLNVATLFFWTICLLIGAVTITRLALYFSGNHSGHGIQPTDAFFYMYLAAISALLAIIARYIHGVVASGEAERAKEESKRLLVIMVLFFFSILFWMAFEQAGSSLNLFADKLTNNNVFGKPFASSYYQSVNSLFLIALAPVFSWIWIGLGDRGPSSPAKFSYGLLFVGLGFVVVAYASSLTGAGKVGPSWLVTVYLLHTIGELCLSPVGLSTVTKLAPPKLVGLMMGVWFLSISLGNYTGGVIAGNFDETAEGALVKLFGYVALITIGAGGLLALLTPYVRKLMGRVH